MASPTPAAAAPPTQPTPDAAWQALAQGNARFVTGEPAHPGQDSTRRAQIRDGQTPFALIFGCSDSRVAAEIVFDQGLGDLFVVRTAGHVIDDAVLGSIEYGVDVLEIPLVIVLGHNSCGAVTATVESYISGTMPRGFVRPLVERIIPSVLAGRRRGLEEVDEFVAEHVDQTCDHLLETSQSVRAAVESGRTAVVGLTYSLSEGTARPGRVHGDLAV